MIPPQHVATKFGHANPGFCLVVLHLRQKVLGETCTSHAMHQHAFCSVGSTLRFFFAFSHLQACRLVFAAELGCFVFGWLDFTRLLLFFRNKAFGFDNI